jgi:hypothetical protein
MPGILDYSLDGFVCLLAERFRQTLVVADEIIREKNLPHTLAVRSARIAATALKNGPVTSPRAIDSSASRSLAYHSSV